ncbi:hypothetical protein MD484_g7320, partial [Candolleomyces efflorescens]
MRAFSMVKGPVAMLLLLLALFQFAAATATHKNRDDFEDRHPEPVNECKPGHSQCCEYLDRILQTIVDERRRPGDTIGMRDDTVIGALLNLVGDIVDDTLGGLNGLIGWKCNPIDILGITQEKCANKPVCCTDMKLNGLVAVGCNPIKISL